MFCHDKSGKALENQVTPEFVDITTCPLGPPEPSAAANTLPSADEATDHHRAGIEVLVLHVAPEFVEVQMYPTALPAAATTFTPSAEQAIPQAPFGAAFETQVVPLFVVA
jgi:hypothetical protein